MPALKWLLLPALALAAAAPAATHTPAPSYPNSSKPAVCAHRGWLANDQVENSLLQMEKTVAAGVPWIEMDLATSKDGTLYLLHDRTLDRTTTAKGPISHYTDGDLGTVYLRDDETITTERIPFFARFVGWLKTNDVHVLVDLKSGSPSTAATMLKLAGLLPRVIFLSFDPETDEKALASDPKVMVSLLVKSTADVDAALVKAGTHPVALYVPQGAAPELFQYAAKTGKPVISDAMDKLDVQAAQNDAAYRDYLALRPMAILVTNRAAELKKSLQ
ncbi:MAG: glycerophosphodiester phosphodiesterase family protein [Acidobacteriaceae bacterium]|nr:glycerophosphodiester phosphodiesterase family protein [Acidobacteriaceae bacterium]